MEATVYESTLNSGIMLRQQSISMETKYVSEAIPEKSLWSAVLLLLLKDADKLNRQIIIYDKIIHKKKHTQQNQRNGI